MASPRDSTAAPAKPQPHRFRVSVPAADKAVLAWMDLQDNPSLSVRMLIRESIERLGYIDVVNRPVAQLSGGRRPDIMEAPARVEAEPLEPSSVSAAHPGALQPKKTTPEKAPPAKEPRLAPVSDEAAGSPADGPMDINDIFAMTR